MAKVRRSKSVLLISIHESTKEIIDYGQDPDLLEELADYCRDYLEVYKS